MVGVEQAIRRTMVDRSVWAPADRVLHHNLNHLMTGRLAAPVHHVMRGIRAEIISAFWRSRDE